MENILFEFDGIKYGLHKLALTDAWGIASGGSPRYDPKGFIVWCRFVNDELIVSSHEPAPELIDRVPSEVLHHFARYLKMKVFW